MIANQLRASLDTIRAQLRRDPALARLGRKISGVKFYDEGEVEIIRAAYEMSRAGRERREAAVA